MVGKPQKSVDQLQFRRGGRVERRTLRVVEPAERRKVRPCPKDLTGIGRAIWRTFWADPVSLAATGVDAYDIHRYCRLIERRDAHEAQLAAEPVIETEHGPQPNPVFKLIREENRQIEIYRAQFGILALNRQRLGLAVVQAESGALDLDAKRQQFTPSREVIDLDGAD